MDGNESVRRNSVVEFSFIQILQNFFRSHEQADFRDESKKLNCS